MLTDRTQDTEDDERYAMMKGEGGDDQKISSTGVINIMMMMILTMFRMGRAQAGVDHHQKKNSSTGVLDLQLTISISLGCSSVVCDIVDFH